MSVFGKRWDPLLFGAPMVVALALIGAFHSTSLRRDVAAQQVVTLVLLVLLDKAHVYSTIFRTYADPQARARWSRRFLLAPLAIFAVIAVVAWHDLTSAGHLTAWLAMFHFIRQQHGWMTWASGRAGDSPAGRRLGQLLIYNCTCFPLLWAASHGGAAWFLPYDVPDALPEAVGLFLLPLHGLGVLYYLVKARHTVAKSLVAVSTWIAWFLPFVLFPPKQRWFYGMILQALVHGIPYVFLAYRYARRRFTEPGTWRFHAARGWGRLGSYGAFCAVAVAESFGITLLVQQGEDHQGLARLAVAAAFSALSTVQVTHFALDAFIWRRGADPTLGPLLASAEAVDSPMKQAA